MTVVLSIAGGVALIVFAVRYMRKGLDRICGNRLGAWIQRVANNRIRALFTGIWIAVVAPSSTSMSILGVQAVQAGHATTRQMLGILLGADIGLTLAVSLIALSMEQFAPFYFLAGVILFQCFSAAKARGLGQLILGIGFLFVGIATIKTAASGIGSNADLQQLFLIAEHHPVFIVFVAALLAFVLQSSTATIALALAFGSASAAPFPLGSAVCVVLGANVGVGITTLIAGWKQIESRRLAACTLGLKIGMALLVVPVFDYTQEALLTFPGGLAAQMAAAHTGFNILKALIFMPATGAIDWLAAKIFPQPPAEQKPVFAPKYIASGEQIESISLALGQSMREIMHQGDIVRSMLADVWRALQAGDEQLVRAVVERDNRVDLLDSEIKRFLTGLATQGLSHDEASEQMRQLRYLAELETIGDIIDKNICELVQKKIKLGVDFSAEGWQELNEFFRRVASNAEMADAAFCTRDKNLAQKLIQQKESLYHFGKELRDKHFARLNSGMTSSHETSAIHLDLLTNLKRINNHLTHVAGDLLPETRRRRSTPKLEGKLREASNEVAAGAPVQEVCKKLGVTETALMRWQIEHGIPAR